MKTKYLIAYFLLCFIGIHSLQAQHQSDYWYFGELAGIDFKSGTPIAHTDGALVTYEGCATISDAAGNLLFYTDGIKVWNANHSQMPNGNALMGDLSSTQSAIIVPKPGSTDIYYIFTTDNGGGSNGLRYSIVDMSLQSGLGNVTTKNVLLRTPVTEKLTAVQHGNNTDYWVIAHEFNTNNFLAYKITASGIDTNAVVSSVGSSQGSMNYQGCLKVSPNGDKLVDVISLLSNKIELFDFDNNTGMVSNPLSIPGYNKPYGVEFSPNGSRLYVSTRQPYRIYQFNLLAGSPSAIINSATQIASGSASGYSLQLGPDYKIYVAKQNETFLSRINNPNALGSSCNYQNNAVNLLGRKCKLGLPSFIQSYYQPDILISGFCPGQITSFQLSDTSVLDSVSWNFGDPGSGTNNTSTAISPVHTYSTPGNYTVSAIVYFNANSKTLTQQLSILSPPLVNLGPDTSICSGTNYILDAGNSAISFLWSTGDTTQQIHTQSSGLYWVEVVSMNACHANDSVQLTFLPQPIIEAGNDQHICKNDSVQLFATGAQYYQWTPAQSLSNANISNPFAKPQIPTEYTVTGISTNGCQGRDSVKVYLKLQPNLVYNHDTIICAGDQAQLYAPPAFSYSWTPSTGLNCDTCQYPIAQPITSRIYTIQVFNQAGCSREATFTVQVAAKPMVEAGKDTTICRGDIIKLNAQISDSSQIVSMQWTPTAGLSSSSIPNPDANPFQSTTYFFTSTNYYGCVSTDSIRIERDNLSVDAGQDVQICPGSGIELKAISNQNANYNWTPQQFVLNPHQANTLAIPNVTSQFLVTVSNNAGCTASDSVNVVVIATQAVDAGSSISICQGSNTTLNASGALQYKWDLNPALSCLTCPDPVASPSKSMYFYVNGTNAQGCQSRDSVWIAVNANPIIQVSADTLVCPGSQVQLHASGALQYEWYPAPKLNCSFCPDPIIYPMKTGVYYVTAQDANGCKSHDSVRVSVHQTSPLSFSGSTSICKGDQTKITVQGAQSYLWSGAFISCDTCANPVLSPQSDQWYHVQAIGINGCTIEDSIFIQVHDLPVLTVSKDTSICQGSNLQLFVSGASTYQWSANNALSCTSCPDPYVSPSISSIFQVSGSNQYGCKSTKSISVNVNPLPSVGVSSDDTVCIGNNIMVQANGADSYTWQPINLVVTSGMQSAVLHPLVTTTFTVTGVDLNGCIDTNTVKIYVQNAANIAVSADTSICQGASTILNASGGNSYTWLPGTGLDCTHCSSPKASPSTSTTYTVQVSDPFGCPGSATVKVSVNPLPQIIMNADQTICAGNQAQLEAKGGVLYHWTPENSLNTPNKPFTIATPTSTTRYTVVVTSTKGCSDSATTWIKVNHAPMVSISEDTAICKGTSVTLEAGGSYFYSWTPALYLDNPNVAMPVATPLSSTIYSVSIADSAGCSKDTTVVVSVIEPANPKISNDTSICKNGMALLHAQNGIEYSWTPTAGLDCPSCAQPNANPEQSTNYHVEIIDINGCKNIDSLWVYLLPGPNLDAGEDIYLKEGGSIQLHASGADYYYWTPGYWLDNPSISNPLASPLDTITYTVIGSNENGCSASDELTIFLYKDAKIRIPNAFSPNADGLNDIFKIKISQDFTLERFMIFNRWGEMVFSTNDANTGWDGNFNGYAQPIGAYVYVISGYASSGEKLQKTGNITLIK